MARNSSQDSYWISFSDIMTGLMVIFMFIALNYIIQVIEYKFVEREIYNTLELQLKSEIKDGTIELSPDGSVRFNLKSKNQELFGVGKSYMTTEFKNILDEFIPKYLKIVTSDDYLDTIKEIRIEGHTDTIPPKKSFKLNSYDYNLKLSSDRAREVLSYVRSHKDYISIPDSIKTRLDFLFTANGLSYSRVLNNNKELTYLSQDKSVNNDLSRRVEFKVVTSNESLVDDIIKENK